MLLRLSQIRSKLINSLNSCRQIEFRVSQANLKLCHLFAKVSKKIRIVCFEDRFPDMETQNQRDVESWRFDAG